MLWYGGLMVAGALVAVLAGVTHRRSSGRHVAIRALLTAAPLALLAVPVLVAPSNPVTSQVPAALTAAYRWTVVFGQLAMWATIASVHAWLGDPAFATEEVDYAATAD